jgi:hypothetical protein
MKADLGLSYGRHSRNVFARCTANAINGHPCCGAASHSKLAPHLHSSAVSQFALPLEAQLLPSPRLERSFQPASCESPLSCPFFSKTCTCCSLSNTCLGFNTHLPGIGSHLRPEGGIIIGCRPQICLHTVLWASITETDGGIGEMTA